MIHLTYISEDNDNRKKNIVTRDTCICFGRCKLGWSCDYIQMEQKKNMLLKEIG